jgi:peptidoglycan/xylan/chitin deacetylase (PgdA/CDA1 family)
VRASFGVTGLWAQANPEAVRRIARNGHTFINHTWTHRSLTGASTGAPALTFEERSQEIKDTEALIHELTGQTTLPYFRCPYGDSDASVQADLASLGYEYSVFWTIDSRGWAGATAEEIIERIRTEAEPGAIVVMHVGSQSQDGPALQGVIDALRADGYEFATVPEIVGE